MAHAKPRMNHFRYNDKLEQPNEMVELLEKFRLVAPYVSGCSESEYLETPILSHPDLNLSNIFVDPGTNTVTSVIDWQGSRVAPLALQAKIPRMVRHIEHLPPGLTLPERPKNYDSLDAEARQAADATHESALCQNYYEVLTAKSNPQFYSAIMHNTSRRAPFIEPLQVVCGSWKNREVYKLRSSLIRVTEHWNELAPDLPQCPIAFEEDEVDIHDKELENIDYIQSMMEGFEAAGILPADGRVDPIDFDALQELNRVQREEYLTLASNEEERAIMERNWPWQDWPEFVG